MTHIVYVGSTDDPAINLLMAIHSAGYVLTLIHDAPMLSVNPPDSSLAVVVELTPATSISTIGAGLAHRDGRWLGWNRADDPALALQAYQAGAFAVVPSTITPDLLLRTIQSNKSKVNSTSDNRHQARYLRGDLILPEPETVVEIQEGVIALSVIHHDGAQVLLGLCGVGQSLISHPHDSCSLQLVAHTNVAVTFRAWPEAASAPDFFQRLRTRLQHLEAWAAMQARPHLDQRILGLLSLLAEQFGEPHPEGTLINVRLTQAQLASAANATRTTITRAIGHLRKRGLLTKVGSGDGERFCLREPEHVRHTHSSA